MLSYIASLISSLNSRSADPAAIQVALAASGCTLAVLALICTVRDYFGWLEHNGYIIYNPLIYAGVKILLPILRASYSVCHASHGLNIRSGEYSRQGDSHIAWLRASKDGRRFIGELPQRREPAPQLPGWYFPQRHIPQLLSHDFRTRIESHMRSLASSHSLLFGRSVREIRGAFSVYSQPSAQSKREFAHDRVHMHIDDGSVHLSLPPQDAAEVIAKGWGVPFILSYWMADKFDAGHVLLFAPRDEGELQVVLKLVEAGVKYNLTKLESSK